MTHGKEVGSNAFRPVGHEWGWAEDQDIWSGPMTDEDRNHWHHTRQAVAQMAFTVYDDLADLLPEENDKTLDKNGKAEATARPKAIKAKYKTPKRAQEWLSYGLERSAIMHNRRIWVKKARRRQEANEQKNGTTTNRTGAKKV